MLDIAKIRSKTPGTDHVTHLNNAGASLPTESVLDTVTSYLREEANYGGYETASARAEGRNRIYTTIADFIGAKPYQIALMESATDAWQRLFYSIPLQQGDLILTTQLEYGSNAIAYMQRCRQTDAEMKIVETDAHGIIDMHALEQALTDRVKVVSITHMPTNSGAIQPVEAIGELLERKNHSAIYLIDACQSVGQYPIDVNRLHCDALTATGRKYLRGPRGTGFLYVSDRILQDNDIEPAMLDHYGAQWVQSDAYTLRDDAKRFERWEANWALRLGLAEAVAYAHQLGIDRIRKRIQMLAQNLRERLDERRYITVTDPGPADNQSGLVTFTVDGVDASDVRRALGEDGINVSVSTRGSARWDMEARSLTKVVRASVHYYNTVQELDRLLTALDSLYN
jgi:cysteine desulfurase/selenocysteine lyase